MPGPLLCLADRVDDRCPLPFPGHSLWKTLWMKLWMKLWKTLWLKHYR